MEKSILKYLAGFNEQIAAIGDKVNIYDLFIQASEGRMNVDQDYSWLDEITKAVNLIEALLGHVHIQAKNVKELRHLETANRVDSQAFNMTIKEPKLWTGHGNVVTPEYVYNNTFEDDLTIYENRFIKLLIDELISYLYDTMNEISYSFGNIHGQINSGPTIAGALKMTDTVNRSGAGILADDNNPALPDYCTVEKLLKKVTRFKYSPLYTECAKKPPLTGAIQQTNILIHDPYYKGCLIFYHKLKRMRFININAEDALYNNILFKLLFAMYRNGYLPTQQTALELTGGRYRCDNYVLAKGEFYIRLDTLSESEIGIATYLNRADGEGKVMNEYVSYTVVNISDYVPGLTESANARYRANRIRCGFNDAFTLVLSHYPINADGVINLINKGSIQSRAADDFVQSLTCMLKGSHRIYSERCPICGSRFVLKNQHSTECSQCGGLWSTVTIRGEEKIWIKRVRYSVS